MTRHRGAISWARVGFGVDLCSGPEPIVVRADRTGGGIRTAPSTVAEAVAAAKRQAAVVGCMGVHEGFARSLAAPYPNPGKARRVFPTLLDVDLPFPLEECLYHFVSERSAGEATVALAIGARKVDLVRRLAVYQELGLDPPAVYHQGVALWAQASREIPRKDGNSGRRPRAIVYLSDTTPALVVGESEHPAGLYGLRREDLAAHVGQLMRARIAVGTPVEWIFAGPGAVDTERLARVESEVTRDWPGTPSAVREPSDFLARALVWEAMVGSALACNMRTGDLSHPMVAQRLHAQNRRSSVAALLAGLALCAVNLTWRSVVQARDDALDARVRLDASELAGFPVAAKGRDAIDQVRASVQEKCRQWAPFLKAQNPVLSGVVAETVAGSAVGGLELSLLTVTDADITVAGDAPTWDSPNALVSLLSSRGYAVSLNRQDARDDGRIPFNVETGGNRE